MRLSITACNILNLVSGSTETRKFLYSTDWLSEQLVGETEQAFLFTLMEAAFILKEKGSMLIRG